ncbi:MAG: flagellar biosynthesis anti-sigma factor FlgM [Deltaproteobacteria bacterium]|nr:flagellar biosynthesis anti-sigma factor FlgM [Deltaproteobacteria bacterium]
MPAQKRQQGQNVTTTAALPVERKESQVARSETRGFLRTEKISRIREQISQGTYQVSATEVAKAILRHGASRVSPKKKEK